MNRSKLHFYRRILFYLFSLVALIQPAFGQNISGVINTYTAISNINSNNLTVSSGAGFAVGNTVLIIQMQGAQLDQSNSPTFGDIISYNNAGNYEFGTITSVNGSSITLQNPLCKSYNITGSVQLVLVPVYNNVTVTDTLTCSPWNGSNGGVLALIVTGTLTLNSVIDVNGKGFRGGEVAHGGFGCNVQSYYSVGGSGGGQKGESIAPFVTGEDGGRGKWAGGGGGGQPGNCGGGGGGNASAGGLGGFEYNGCGATNIQGFGGLALAYTTGKAFMGSGGGGGFSDNFQPVTPGTNGGGIIMIKANTIVGNNYTIRSDGPNQTGISSDESAGGGGSGGCINLEVQNFTGNLNIEVNGGDGGSTYNHIFTGQCHGPGGGGGAGMLLINQPSLPTNVTLFANGGTCGLVLNPSSACYNTTFGGTAGAGTPATSSTFNFLFPQQIVKVDLGNDTAICPNSSFQLNAGSGYASYLWQDNSTNQTFTVNDSGAYYVTVSNGLGCTSMDTVLVTFKYSVPVNLGNDTSFCTGTSVSLNAGSGFSSYVWQDGSANQTFTVSTPGTFAVTVTNTSGCSGTDNINIGEDPLPVVNLGNNTSICPGTSITLNAGAGATDTYLWQDNSTDSMFTVRDSGAYAVKVTSAFHCITRDSVLISLKPAPIINLGNDTTVCARQVVLLNPNPDAGFNFSSYSWQDGSANPTLTVLKPGLFAVSVTNNVGCTTTDKINISQNPLPVVNLGNDTALCPGNFVTLDAGAGSGNTIYLWQDNSTQETYATSIPGTYSVRVTNNFGCEDSDAINILPTLSAPPSNLVPNQTVCPGIPSVLTAPSGYIYYIWDYGSVSGQQLTVKDTGTHILTVTNTNLCSNSDTIILTAYCEPTLYFPNAFSPNSDGTNDVFKAFGVNITNYHLEIFDRWGERIFETSVFDRGWDGTFNNQNCSVGVYTYFATFSGVASNGGIKSGLSKGSVTLIR